MNRPIRIEAGGEIEEDQGSSHWMVDSLKWVLSWHRPPSPQHHEAGSPLLGEEEEGEMVLPLDYSEIIPPTPVTMAGFDYEGHLPHDYEDVLGRAVSLVSYSSAEDLYLRLCRSIPIDGGEAHFWLDKLTGVKCYMLSMRKDWIIWGANTRYWKWRSDLDARFAKVAELLEIRWLEVNGYIDSTMLSPGTTYIVYLIFKLRSQARGLRLRHQRAYITVKGETLEQDVIVDPRDSDQGRRQNGWKALAMGEFTNEQDAGQIHVKLMGSEGTELKSGLVIEGYEFRPKKEILPTRTLQSRCG